MEASDLSGIEFKVMVIRVHNSMTNDIETKKIGPVRNEEYNI